MLKMLTRSFYLIGVLVFICSQYSSASIVSSLTDDEVSVIEQKLSAVPITKKRLLALMYDPKLGSYFDQEFLAEVEGILKASLVDGDTQVYHLTPEIREELNIDRWVAAFHKQGEMGFMIVPSRYGGYQDEKQNDTIRNLTHPDYFSNKHNVFVADGQVNNDGNPLSLLLHELSHAAFDYWITTNPRKINQIISRYVSIAKAGLFFKRAANGTYQIDGDIYDLLSEKYAFELEYRLNRQITRHNSQWPFAFSFAEAPSKNYSALIDDYVRRNYNIDHPELERASDAAVSPFLVP